MEIILSRFFSRLSLLAANGVLVLRNPTTAFTVPLSGAVVMIDNGPTSTDRGETENYYSHRIRLELYLPIYSSVKTMTMFEDEVATILRGDRTLSNAVDQMFLIPTGGDIASGGGPQVNVSAFTVQMEYGESL